MTKQIGNSQAGARSGHSHSSTLNVRNMETKVIAKVVLAMAAFGGLWLPLHANAQDCSQFVENIVNTFGNIPAGSQGQMEAALVSNRSDGQYVSYGEMPSLSGNSGSSGKLVYYPASRGLPPYLKGTLSQFFSNRRFEPNKSGPLGSQVSDPFNPNATDSLGVVVYLGTRFAFPASNDITPGEVVFTLNSWGGGSFSFRGQCQDGMINGFIGNTEFVLSLFNQNVFTPPPLPQ